MIEIARLPADDRRELFHNTAAKTGLHDAIVEKDFWVCLTLDYLFHRSPWKKTVTFKGGTRQFIQRVSPYQPVFRGH